MNDEVRSDAEALDEHAAAEHGAADEFETPDEAVSERAEQLRTGNEAVDEVLASMDGLSDLPLEEHVTVFERAHERLRGALDGPREP